MTINSASGAKLYISNAAVASTIDTVAEFGALTWIEVGEVENLGEFGDQANPIPFAALGDARVRKSKGARDAGDLAVVCGHDPRDVGQLALNAAEATDDNYGFKVVNPDSETPLYSNSISYFRGIVLGKRLNVGTNDNIVRRNYTIAVNSQIFEVPSALLTT